jgi:uncharacterized protein YecT (DUF1311 family)
MNSKHLACKPWLASLMLSITMQLPAWAAPCDNLRTQLDQNECAHDGYQKADKQLNKVYGDYRKRLNSGQQVQLKQAQVAWLKFRDAHCVFESSGVEGGSAHTMIYLNCMTSVTQDRTQAIQSLSSCQEGDLSCPAPKSTD